MIERTQGEQRFGDAAFHVVDAGAAHGISVDRKRHALERAERPDGVEVPKQELSPLAGSPATPGEYMAGSPAAPGFTHGEAEIREQPGQYTACPGTGAGVSRGRFRRREILQDPNEAATLFRHPVRQGPGVDS